MNVKDTFLEVVYGILPIAIIVLIFQMTIVKFPTDVFINFIAGALMVIIGLVLFITGINVGLLKVGEFIGNTLSMKENIWIILLLGFIIGLVITVAEPNVQVLSSQVDAVSDGAISKNILTGAVALGVGVFIALSLFRIVFDIPLVYVLAGSYGLAFLLSIFTSPQFVPVSFDAGGVTTGPLTVPFFLSLGVGVTSVRPSKKSSQDSFGLVSLVFIGAILSVLILGVIFK